MANYNNPAEASLTSDGSQVLASGYSIEWESLHGNNSNNFKAATDNINKRTNHRSRRTFFSVAVCTKQNTNERTLHKFNSPSDRRSIENVRMEKCLWLVDGEIILLQTPDTQHTWLLTIDESDFTQVERWHNALFPNGARLCRHYDDFQQLQQQQQQQQPTWSAQATPSLSHTPRALPLFLSSNSNNTSQSTSDNNSTRNGTHNSITAWPAHEELDFLIFNLGLEGLRNTAANGSLWKSRVRSVCWRWMLGCLPTDPKGWGQALGATRERYERDRKYHLVSAGYVVESLRIVLHSSCVHCKSEFLSAAIPTAAVPKTAAVLTTAVTTTAASTASVPTASMPTIGSMTEPTAVAPASVLSIATAPKLTTEASLPSSAETEAGATSVPTTSSISDTTAVASAASSSASVGAAVSSEAAHNNVKYVRAECLSNRPCVGASLGYAVEVENIFVSNEAQQQQQQQQQKQQPQQQQQHQQSRPWKQYVRNRKLHDLITKDLDRTRVLDPVFYSQHVQEQMSQVLLVWACMHSQGEYVQGMNEVLAVVLELVIAEYTAEDRLFENRTNGYTNLNLPTTSRSKSAAAAAAAEGILPPLSSPDWHGDKTGRIPLIKQLCKVLTDERFIEHDAYAIFARIMQAMKPLYYSQDDMSVTSSDNGDVSNNDVHVSNCGHVDNDIHVRKSEQVGNHVHVNKTDRVNNDGYVRSNGDHVGRNDYASKYDHISKNGHVTNSDHASNHVHVNKDDYVSKDGHLNKHAHVKTTRSTESRAMSFDMPVSAIDAALQQDGLRLEQRLETCASQGLVDRAPELLAVLEASNVSLSMFLVPWLRLVLARQVKPVSKLLLLWDAIFALTPVSFGLLDALVVSLLCHPVVRERVLLAARGGNVNRDTGMGKSSWDNEGTGAVVVGELKDILGALAKPVFLSDEEVASVVADAKQQIVEGDRTTAKWFSGSAPALSSMDEKRSNTLYVSRADVTVDVASMLSVWVAPTSATDVITNSNRSGSEITFVRLEPDSKDVFTHSRQANNVRPTRNEVTSEMFIRREKGELIVRL